MARPKKASVNADKTEPIETMLPSLDPQVRQNQLISLSVNLAEKQLLEGTASSQVITHFLKLAAERERAQLELQIMEKQKALLDAKTEALHAERTPDEVYMRAIDAMRLYTGDGRNDQDVP